MYNLHVLDKINNDYYLKRGFIQTLNLNPLWLNSTYNTQLVYSEHYNQTNYVMKINVLDALVLVQRSTESKQTTHATACTMAQILMLTRSRVHDVGRSASVALQLPIRYLQVHHTTCVYCKNYN